MQRRRVEIGVALLLVVMIVGYMTKTQLHVSVGDWPRGDQRDPMGNTPVIDVPGLSIFREYCGGLNRVDLELGATRRPNPCHDTVLAGGVGWYVRLPGSKVVWRCDSNGGPWRYFIADAYGPHAPTNPPYDKCD